VLILDEPMHGAGHSFAQKLGQLLVRLNRELG
jgi:ABC-type branched-subunit amino acid transport system ATPase component